MPSLGNPTASANAPTETVPGRWLAAIIVSLYYITVWTPPVIEGLENRWYLPLGLALAAFIIEKPPFNLKATGIYWAFYGLSFLGATLSLLRAPAPEEALWNTVGMGIIFITFLLFIPVLATRNTRRLLLVVIVITSFLWTFEIQRLVNEYGTLAYSTFSETGENKNSVGYVMALGGTILFYLAAFWRPARPTSTWKILLLRLLFSMGVIYFFYFQAIIYARGSILATFSGILVVFAVVYLKSKRKLLRLFQIGVLLFIILSLAVVLVPRIVETSPYWNSIYTRAFSQGVTSVLSGRDVLFEKGLYLISQNPFIGVGNGGARAPVSGNGIDYPGYLLHNTFMTEWAEHGILGMISTLIWLVAYLNLLKNKFWTASQADQIWLLLFIPLIVQMNLKNISAVAMLAILAGMYYEYHILDQKKLMWRAWQMRRR